MNYIENAAKAIAHEDALKNNGDIQKYELIWESYVDDAVNGLNSLKKIPQDVLLSFVHHLYNLKYDELKNIVHEKKVVQTILSDLSDMVIHNRSGSEKVVKLIAENIANGSKWTDYIREAQAVVYSLQFVSDEELTELSDYVSNFKEKNPSQYVNIIYDIFAHISEKSDIIYKKTF